MAELNELSKAVLDGDLNTAKEVTQKLLDQGVAPSKIVNDGLIVGMNEVGRLFKANEYQG